MPKHSLTILIPTHGRPTLLKRTLASLEACTLPESYHELVVIENGSRSGAETVVANLPDRLNARYMHESWGNKSNALNTALETIEDGLVVFFDDDVQVEPGVLMAYDNAATLHADHRYVFFGGPVDVTYEEEPPAEWMASRFPSSVRGYDLVNSRMLPNRYIGFNWAAFSVDIREAGGFDPRFGPGSLTLATGQEVEMQNRLFRRGQKSVDVNKALVSHYVPTSHTTLKWLLRRRWRDGIRTGIHMKECKTVNYKTVLVSLMLSTAVIIRGVVSMNTDKLSIGLSSIALQWGIVVGLWKQ